MAMKFFKKSSLRKWQAIIIILLMALIYIPRGTKACGPFFEQAFFTFTVHPDFPMTRYAAGELGVLQPSYARSYLTVAYRYIAGIGYDKEEQNALAAVWEERLKPYWESSDTEDWTKAWLDARKKVVPAGEPPIIDVNRSIEAKDFYGSYVNCNRDAFKTAAETLNRMIEKYGATRSEVKEWVEAQDEVFKDCSDGKSIPAPAPAFASALVKANRAYQIATANFYAGNFDEAQRLFTDISKDSSSPWRQVAPYLVARTLIRKGTLVPEQGKVDAASLTQAEAQLKKILSDSTLVSLHDSTNGLLRYVRLRLQPEQHLHELAQAMMRRNSARTLKQDLMDYTLLIDRYVKDEGEEDRKFANLSSVGRSDDITDWVLTYQIKDKNALEYSIKKWEQSAQPQWLVAAISKVDAKHPKAASLIEAAAKVKPGTPAFVTVAFHSLRLMIESNRKDEARAALTRLLATSGAQLQPSARNLFMQLATRTARSLDEFLKYAQRIPAGISADEDGRELPSSPDEQDKARQQLGKQVLFDTDVTQAINEAMPLAVLKVAATSQTLAPHLRRFVALAAWTKAVLLDDEATAREITPVLSEFVPELKQSLDAYLAATTPAERKFAAVYFLLKFPGTRPVVDAGLGRQTEIGKLDDFRDNWWCAPGIGRESPAEASSSNQVKETVYPDFLTAVEQAKAKQELDKLKALGPAPNFLSAQAVAWANAKPTDPRAPEALHLAVRSTRYGCKDEKTGDFSKLAFDTLHRKYPRSDWAAKTKYWYRSDQ